MPPASPSGSHRLDSIDLLRGLVIALMAIDHARVFLHTGFINGIDPLDFATTTPQLFLTRWITHYCAPVFSFLAGTAVWLSLRRGKSVREVSWFLLTRGGWLILLEMTVLNWFGWIFAIELSGTYLGTLFALGGAMVMLAALIHLPVRVVAGLALAILAGHNALDGIAPDSWGAGARWWQILHAGGWFEVGPGIRINAQYPLLPWVGVMTAGHAFGALVTGDPASRRRRFLTLGLAGVGGFVLLRASNLYGDPAPWSEQSTPLFTVLSFLNCTKYPPSLCFVLMTIGPALLLLARVGDAAPAWAQPLVTLGRVPMFFYLLHIPLLHAMAVGVEMLRFGRADWLFGAFPPTPPAEAGFGLPVVYLAWLAAVLALYPACCWFEGVKRRHRDQAWLSYL